MWLDEFPACCGINVIDGFGRTKPSKKEIANFNSCVEEHMDEGAGMLLIALADYQQKNWEPFLLNEAKFKVMRRNFKNPRHGSTITLYGKTTPSAKQKEVEVGPLYW